MSAAIDRLREQLTREGPTNLVLVVRTEDLREALSAIESAEAAEREACAAVVDKFVDNLSSIRGDVFSPIFHAQEIARNVVRLAARMIRARGRTPATPDSIDPAAAQVGR